jgi:hypothetical protein
MDKFLEADSIPKFYQKDINLLNRFITNNEIEVVIKSLPTKIRQVVHRFTSEFYQTFKEKLTPMFLKLFHRIEREGRLPNSVLH